MYVEGLPGRTDHVISSSITDSAAPLKVVSLRGHVGKEAKVGGMLARLGKAESSDV